MRVLTRSVRTLVRLVCGLGSVCDAENGMTVIAMESGRNDMLSIAEACVADTNMLIKVCERTYVVASSETWSRSYRSLGLINANQKNMGTWKFIPFVDGEGEASLWLLVSAWRPSCARGPRSPVIIEWRVRYV